MKKWALFVIIGILCFSSSSYQSSTTTDRGWRRAGYDIGRTRYYPYPSVPNTGILQLKWKLSNPGMALIADLNGDNLYKIILSSNNSILILDKNGNILRTIPQPSNAVFYRSNYVGDINGDGAPEIFVDYSDSNCNTKFDIYSGSGALLKTITGPGAPVSPNCGYWTPFHNIGDNIFIAIDIGYSCIYLGQLKTGAGVWSYSTGSAQWVNYYTTQGAGGWSFSMGDINGNGIMDLALRSTTPHTCGSNNLHAVLVDQNGTTIFDKTLGDWATSGNVNGEFTTMFVDLDGDGKDDIVGFEAHNVNYPGYDRIYLVNSIGQPLNGLSGWAGTSQSGRRWSYAAADLNKDGYKEVIASTWEEGKLYILDHSLTTVLREGQPGEGYVLGVNDINGDGIPEIIVYQKYTGKIRILRPDLSEISNYVIGTASGLMWHEWPFFAITDIDNDGLNEIVVSTDSEFVVLGVQQLVPSLKKALIDIKPGSSINPINLDSEGVIPVAVLGGSDFNVWGINPTSVVFGPASAKDIDGKVSYEDVNRDGYTDAVFHFNTQETGLTLTDTTATLRGRTFDGVDFYGADTVRMMENKKESSMGLGVRGCNNKR